VLWAATAAVPANAFLGRVDRALALADQAIGLAVRHRDELPWVEAQLGYARCQALLGAGRLQEAWAVAEAGYRRSAASRSQGQTGGWAGFRGLVARAQGRMATAQAALREAVALLDELDPYRFVRVFQGELAAVSALVGDAAGAASWLAAAEARAGEANKVFDPWLELDRAWVAAAQGELSRAAGLARGAAEAARASEQHSHEAVALYDLARLGDPAAAAGRLAELATAMEGELVAAFAAASAALAAADGAALDQAAAGFAELGASLLAAEAALAAARAHRAAGRRLAANASLERASALAAVCEGSQTPLLDPAGVGSVLTPREREVAMLAASGVASREIALRLELSVRTVNNYLGRACAKLGISSRAQLTAVLTTRGD